MNADLSSAGDSSDQSDPYLILNSLQSHVTLAEILRANDNVAKVIEDYRRIVGTPGDPVGISVAASLGSSTTPDLVQSNDQSSNLSSLIDLDIGANNVPQPSQNGDILSNDLQALGELLNLTGCRLPFRYTTQQNTAFI